MADRQLGLIKKEVTYGVDPVAAAADTIWMENAKFTPKGERKRAVVDRPGVGPVPGFITDVSGEFTFDTPLANSGTRGTAPNWGKIAKACGYSETIVATTSVTYALANNPALSDSLSIVWREGRRLHKLSGSRGMITFKLTDSERPMMSVTLRGLKTPVTDGALLVAADATWAGWQDVPPINQALTSFSFAGQASPFRDLQISQSDNVVFSDRPNQRSVDLVGDRSLTGKLKVGSLLPSLLNFEALAEAATVSTFSLVHGLSSGSVITINGRAQNNQPTYSDDKGLDVTDVDLEMVASGFGADDDFAIVLT